VCNLEFPDLQVLYQQRSAEGLVVLGIDAGGLGGGEATSHVQGFLDQTGITFPVFWDDGTYGDWGWPPATAPFPRQAVIDRDGKVTFIASEYQADALQAAVEAAL
jgi:peroxiredoxin